MGKDRSFLETDTDLELVCQLVLFSSSDFGHFLFHHELELNIDFDAVQLVVGFSDALHLSNFVCFESSGFSVELDLINLVSCAGLLAFHYAVRGLETHVRCFCLGCDSILLLESVSPLLRSAIGWQTFLFEFVEDCLW